MDDHDQLARRFGKANGAGALNQSEATYELAA